MAFMPLRVLPARFWAHTHADIYLCSHCYSRARVETHCKRLQSDWLSCIACKGGIPVLSHLAGMQPAGLLCNNN